MSFSLVLNQSNSVPNTNNTIFEYKFIGGNFKAEDMEVCVSQAVVPYSWFNISSALGNNTLTITWVVGGSTIITFPDGFYTITTINAFIQQQSILNGWYLINSSGEYVYYISIVENATYYSNQVLLNAVPTSLPAGFTAPANFAGFSAGGECPSMSFPVGSISAIVGFPVGTTIASIVGSQSVLSTITPLGSIVNAVVIRSNFVDNNVVSPNDILDSFPINSAFGNNINYTPSFPRYLPIANGVYSSFRIALFDEALNPIIANDNRSLFNLHIRKVK